MNENKLVAMIPARLGSKRIPRKNLRYLADKPLIYYPIDLTLESGCFDSIWVNTESVELGMAAQARGVNFHKRPEELAGDKATNREFTYEFLLKHECDYVVMVNPTSPLLTLDTLKEFVNYLKSNNFDSLFAVVSYKSEAFYMGEPINFDVREKINSQYITPVDVNAGAIIAWKRESFIRNQKSGINPVFAGNRGLFPIPKDESCDLDTPEDWKIAEGFLMSRRPELKFPERYLDIKR